MYSPKIKEEFIRKLFQFKQKQQVKKPMTYYVNEAIKQYLNHLDNKSKDKSR